MSGLDCFVTGAEDSSTNLLLCALFFFRGVAASYLN